MWFFFFWYCKFVSSFEFLIITTVQEMERNVHIFIQLLLKYLLRTEWKMLGKKHTGVQTENSARRSKRIGYR